MISPVWPCTGPRLNGILAKMTYPSLNGKEYPMLSGKTHALGLLAVLVLLAFGLTVPGFGSELSKETAALIKKAPGLEKYPDANAIVIKNQTDYEYQADGTCLARDYVLAKIMTEAGFRDYGEIRVPFYRIYDTLVVTVARVIKQDGTVIDVPREDMKDISSASSEEMNIYEQDALERVIPFKNLEVGDCIELNVDDYVFRSPLEAEFDGLQIFQRFDPILYKEVNVVGLKSLPLKYIVKNGKVKFAQKETGDKIKYTWTAENVDRIIPEPAMPSLAEIAPTVIFSTIGSWEEISRWWNDMAGKQMTMNDGLREKVKELTAGKTTRDEKIDAIYRFVAQEIRYMGLGTGKKKGLEPKPATETFETKYGVCRDVATLMVAMLREADVPSNVVLTMVGDKVASDIPHFYFNHAIVAIPNADGSVTYADPTINNSVDWLPAVESQQQVLVCDDKGEKLADTPLTPARENMGAIKAVTNLTETGLLTSEVTITTDGIYDLAIRSWAKSVPSAQMSMVWSYLLQDVYPGARLTNLTFSDPEDLGKPFELKLSYQVENYPTAAGEFVLMKSPVSMGAFEIISKYLLSSASLPERKYPFALGFTFGASEEEVINLPPGMKIKSMPDPVSLQKGPVEYRMTYNSSASKELAGGATQVTYQKELLINSKQMSPEEYAQFKSVMKAASKSARGELIMQRDNAANN